MSFPSKKRLTLAEVLENLDFFCWRWWKGPVKSETTIFVTRPQEADNHFSEEDIADKDCTEFALNNLGRKFLWAEAEAYRQDLTLHENRK